MPETEGPCWGTPLAVRSWFLPGPHSSLTMMATPENMMAETSCQTLRERGDRGPGMSLEVTPSLILHKAFLAACSFISLQPSPMHKRDSQKPPMERLSFPHLTSSSLNMQTSLAGETEPDSPSPKQRREVTLPRGWCRAGSPQDTPSCHTVEQEHLQPHISLVVLCTCNDTRT